MKIIMTALLVAAQVSPPRAGVVVQARGAGKFSCATAFLLENHIATENWIAGFWTAWDMARVNEADPAAASADLDGIVGEVKKVCRDQPSATILSAALLARHSVLLRTRIFP